MYILIVEDDKLHFEQLKQSLIDEQTISLDRIERIATESEFREKFESIAAAPPDIVVLDMMIKWANKRKWVELPHEIAEAGFFLAGARCEKMLSSDERTKDIPIIIHSQLDKKESQNFIPPRPQINYLDKDFGLGKISNLIKRIFT